uniref:C2H2-type domain-containing protein n=1 Tax=Lotharella globosa TaxID=91324 RepID=A0A7S3Z7R3_9EUKA|mmetsp:Transcript_616/g.1199  ORF Transcript_616/g.1199 Transcript_616/m.1199 type:complete len:553 (-) Transcript_616:703-2361(-)
MAYRTSPQGRRRYFDAHLSEASNERLPETRWPDHRQISAPAVLLSGSHVGYALHESAGDSIGDRDAPRREKMHASPYSSPASSTRTIVMNRRRSREIDPELFQRGRQQGPPYTIQPPQESLTVPLSYCLYGEMKAKPGTVSSPRSGQHSVRYPPSLPMSEPALAYFESQQNRRQHPGHLLARRQSAPLTNYAWSSEAPARPRWSRIKRMGDHRESSNQINFNSETAGPYVGGNIPSQVPQRRSPSALTGRNAENHIRVAGPPMPSVFPAPSFPAPTVRDSPPGERAGSFGLGSPEKSPAHVQPRMDLCDKGNKMPPVPALPSSPPRLVRSQSFGSSKEMKLSATRSQMSTMSMPEVHSGRSGTGVGGGITLQCSFERSGERNGKTREGEQVPSSLASNHSRIKLPTTPIPAVVKDECKAVEAVVLKQHIKKSSGDGFIAFIPVSSGFDNDVKPRQYKCLHCKKIFRQRSTVVAHVRTHTGEKPFKCKLCNRGFAQRSNLRRHEYTRHETHMSESFSGGNSPERHLSSRSREGSSNSSGKVTATATATKHIGR